MMEEDGDEEENCDGDHEMKDASASRLEKKCLQESQLTEFTEEAQCVLCHEMSKTNHPLGLICFVQVSQESAWSHLYIAWASVDVILSMLADVLADHHRHPQGFLFGRLQLVCAVSISSIDDPRLFRLLRSAFSCTHASFHAVHLTWRAGRSTSPPVVLLTMATLPRGHLLRPERS